MSGCPREPAVELVSRTLFERGDRAKAGNRRLQKRGSGASAVRFFYPRR